MSEYDRMKAQYDALRRHEHDRIKAPLREELARTRADLDTALIEASQAIARAEQHEADARLGRIVRESGVTAEDVELLWVGGLSEERTQRIRLFRDTLAEALRKEQQR